MRRDSLVWRDDHCLSDGRDSPNVLKMLPGLDGVQQARRLDLAGVRELREVENCVSVEISSQKFVML